MRGLVSKESEAPASSSAILNRLPELKNMLQADEKKKETMEIGESAGDMAILGVDAPPHRVVAEAPSLVGILYKSVAEKLFEELPGDKATF